MKAKFIGEDRSLGFVNGATYNIETCVESNWFSMGGLIIVYVVGSRLNCPYSNIEKFLENWEVME